MTLQSVIAPGNSIAEAFVSRTQAISPTVMRLGSGSSGRLSIVELEATIVVDAEFTLRTLALANSAFYSQQHEIRSLRGALVVLGANTVHNLAASLLARALHASPAAPDENLLAHSHAVGTMAQMLCEAHNLADPQSAFAAGLLHDTGILALQALNYEDEQEFANHDQLGGDIAQLLGLSPSLASAIRRHGDADDFDDHEYTALEATVYVANQIAIACDYSHEQESSGDPAHFDQLIDQLNLTAADIDELAAALPDRLEFLEACSL